MPRKYRNIIVFVLFVVLVVLGLTTYITAKNSRDALISLMHKDAVSLANIFSEGARRIYEIQSFEIIQERFRLEREARRVERSGVLFRHLPADAQLAIILDENGSIIDTAGTIDARRKQWIAVLKDIIAPIVDGGETSLFFGLDPEFPVGSEPMGFAKKMSDGKILVIFAKRPFPESAGIGLFARQLAETPSVRYIILQNRSGIIIASKDVYRATSIEADEFLKRVISQKNPESRFIDFEGERVFELAYPFPALGEFYGILRIGLPLSEYREFSTIVWWTLLVGIILALIIISAGISLIIVVNKIFVLRQEHQRFMHLRSLGEVAASVAHEIRNPLNAIAISLQRLNAEFSPAEDNSEYREILSSARSQINRIDNIVKEFIAVAGNVSPVRIKKNVAQFLSDISSRHKKIADAKNVRLSAEIAEDIDSANWDFEKVGRAVENILKNAVEATGENGTVQLLAKRSGGVIRIEIFNSGSRIPEDVIDRIFEPFHSGKSNGTGMGLFYAYRIIDAHGGKIFVKNEADGVRFIIEMPA